MGHWFVEAITGLMVTVFWGVFYAWTAVSLLSIIYAVLERFSVGDRFSGITIRYDGSGFMRGIMVAVAGLAGLAVGWLVIPLIAGAAPLPPPSRLFGDAGTGEKLGIAIAMLSTIVFNIGVWIALTAEEWTGEPKT